MRTGPASIIAALLLLSSFLLAQAPGPDPLVLLTAQGRRPFPTSVVNGQEMVDAADLVSLLQVAVRDDDAAGGLSISYRGRSLVVSPDQPVASVSGRIITLPTRAIRRGRRWLLPLDVIPRAISLIYDSRIELRRPSRLLIVGNLRVPRVTVRLDASGPPTRLSIEATPPARITPTLDAGRVVLRLDADALDVAPLPQGAGLLEQVRAEGASMVLFLTTGAGQPRATQAGSDTASRLNVEIPAGAADQTSSEPVTPPLPQVGGTGLPAPAAGDSRILVIDPGHGGTDVGVTSPGGLQEKVLTLDLARRVRALLDGRQGLRVLLTRDDDRELSHDDRTAYANTSDADFFISLHMNAGLSPAASGAEVYQLRRPSRGTTFGEGGDERVLTLPLPGGGARPITLVPWDRAQLRHREDSTLLANLLEASLRAHVPMSTRPLQEAPLRVLTGLDSAGVVVEVAYLTNGEQEAALRSDGFLGRAAQAIFEAITAYRAARQGER